MSDSQPHYDPRMNHSQATGNTPQNGAGLTGPNESAAIDFASARLVEVIRQAVVERQRLSELLLQAEKIKSVQPVAGAGRAPMHQQPTQTRPSLASLASGASAPKANAGSIPLAAMDDDKHERVPAGSSRAEHWRAMDVAVSRKLEKLQATEAALDARLDKLARFETSIQKLMSGFQTKIDEMASARQISTRLQEEFAARIEHAANDADTLVARVDERIHDQLGTLNNREQHFIQKTDELEARLERATAESDELVNTRLERAERQIGQRLDRAHVLVSERLDEVESVIDRRLVEAGQTATQFNHELEQRMNELREQVEAQRGKFDGQLNDLQAHVQRSVASAQNLIGEEAGRLRTSADELQRRVTEQCENAQQHANKTMATTETELSQRCRELDQQVADAQHKMTEHENHLQAVMANVLRQVEAAAAKTEPRIASMAEDATSTMDMVLHDTLQKACERVRQISEDFEQEFKQRIDGIAVEAIESVNGTEVNLRDRIKQLREDATSMVDMVERQLTRRIDKLDPKANRLLSIRRQQLDQLTQQIKTIAEIEKQQPSQFIDPAA